ncbi:MAG: cytochrome c oxidase subunit 3 [Acidobacteria bacterium]|nr:cytochrome c oxidase subunit 3 [Acidobacteriota bacterium]
METTITTDLKIKTGMGAGGGKNFGDDGGGPQGADSNSSDWPPGYSPEDAIEPTKYRIAVWLGLTSIAMLFIALTSAYILRQYNGMTAAKPDWQPLHLPSALWITTAIILLSSLSFEIARRALKQNRYEKFKTWISLTTALGFLFLAGQVLAWRQLASQGIYLRSNPHSSFFYVLTGLHALHLLGGIVVLSYVLISAWRLRIGLRKRTTVEVTSLYWHFMDGLWVYLFVLLFFF